MSDLVFMHNTLLWPAIVAAFLLFLVFVFKEWAHRHGSHFGIRVTVAGVAILALLTLALQPAMPMKVQGKQGVLLTPGFIESQVDSLKKLNPKLKTIDYAHDAAWAKNLDSLNAVLILGNGVKAYDLWQLQDKQVTFMGGILPSGIDRAVYEKEAFEGDAWQVKAHYFKPVAGNKIFLQAPGNLSVDSIRFTSGRDTVFSLKAKLKAPGHFVYQLVETDSLDKKLGHEPLPLYVRPRQVLNILVLNAFPTFETKYLKNYLVGLGHQVMVRSRLTQGRYKYEYFNRKRSTFTALTAANLADVDLVIIDGEGYRDLSTSEQKVLENAVRDDGLGVFIQPDEQLLYGRQNLVDFNLVGAAVKNVSLERQVNLETHGFAFGQDALLNVNLKVGGTTYAADKFLGFGRVGTTILTNTYQLQLQGNEEAYKRLWSGILKPMLKQPSEEVFWEETEALTYVNEPYTVKWRTGLKDFTVEDDYGNVLPVMENPNLDELWSARFYAAQSGWHEISIKMDSTVAAHSYYVQDSLDWTAREGKARAMINGDYFSTPVAAPESLMVFNPIHPLYFFTIFLLAMGYLWLQPKLLD